MSYTVDAVFDGEVFRPQQHLDIPVDTNYRITIDTLGNNLPLDINTNASVLDSNDALTWQIYDEKLKAILEPEHHGELVAIHIDSGDYEVQRSSPKAWRELRKRQPTGRIDVVGIGLFPVDNSLSLRANGGLLRGLSDTRYCR